MHFFGGKDMYSWTNIYWFSEELPTVDLYSSTANIFSDKTPDKRWWARIDDIFPWLYAKLRNKKNKAENDLSKRNNVVFIDFVEL